MEDDQDAVAERDPETAPTAPADAGEPSALAGERSTMIPARGRRRHAAERISVRLIATAGVVAIGVAIAAILGSQEVAAWTIGLVVSLVSVLLAAVLWSSRQL